MVGSTLTTYAVGGEGASFDKGGMWPKRSGSMWGHLFFLKIYAFIHYE